MKVFKIEAKMHVSAATLMVMRLPVDLQPKVATDGRKGRLAVWFDVDSDTANRVLALLDNSKLVFTVDELKVTWRYQH